MLNNLLLKLLAIGVGLYLSAGVSAILGAAVGVIMWLTGIVEPKGILVCVVLAAIAGIALALVLMLDDEVAR